VSGGWGVKVSVKKKKKKKKKEKEKGHDQINDLFFISFYTRNYQRRL